MIEMQAALLRDLQAQVEVLQERVKLDSQTFSKPPSSDGPGRPNRAHRACRDLDSLLPWNWQPSATVLDTAALSTALGPSFLAPK